MRGDWIAAYAKKIDNALLKSFTGNSKLHEMAKEVLFAGGKRIRGTLAILGCEAVGGAEELGTKIGVIYELAHAASLIEDDLIDGSRVRRGNPTFHVKYGLNSAILAADLLIFKIFEEVAWFIGKVDESKVKKVLIEGTKSSSSTTIGQFTDLDMGKLTTPDEKMYLEMIRKKTGSLISSPLLLGAVVGGGTQEQINLLESFGEKLGMAYQIKDDLLDIFGEELDIGKETFLDVKAGLKNLAIINAVSKASDEDKKKIISILGKENISEKEISEFRGILIKTGAKQYAENKAKELIGQANQDIEKLDSTVKDKLKEIAKFAVKRYR